jgi:tetratricopeptide (TPR) repeat protein
MSRSPSVKNVQGKALQTPPLDQAVVTNSVPLTTRLAIEIPKPKDWQAFQRNCVLLFRAELNDPHAQEYGRGGQNQGGIDILARRNGKDDQFVGVQCRLVTKPLKEAKILADARAALKLIAGLSELVFATTAPDDTGAANAAIAVSRMLKAEGHDLTVVVYGWGQLQTLIAPHDVAYNAFHPSAVASAAIQATGPMAGGADFAALVATQVVEQMRGTGLTAGPGEDGAPGSADEDPALHARIDTFRDLLKEQAQPLLAEKGLLGLLEKEDLTAKPWARYRIESNLGSIAIDLGREKDAATHFEAAHAIRPDDPNGLANLALARTIQGRFEEAMVIAQAALNSKPRSDHAVGYLLQAAARSNWTGEPEALIPQDLLGTAHADIGLAEFLRRREVPGWAERSLEMARRHTDNPDFRRIQAIAVLSLAIDSGATVPGGRGPVTTAELNAAADDMKAVVEHFLDVGFADVHDLAVHLSNAATLLRLCERHEESEALLVRGMPRVGDEPQLRRLLALARTVQDRNTEAISTLAGDTDPENRILRAELQASTGDVAGSLAEMLAIDPSGLSERLQRLRLRLLGEMAVRLGDDAKLAVAIDGLRALNPHDITASLLEIRGGRKKVEDEEVVHDRLRALAASLPADLDMVSRYFLAAELKDQELAEEASRLLDGHVDLSRPSPATSLYLQSLASARRDDAFRAALAQVTPEVRNDPATLWTVAAHAWNLGDLNASIKAVENLLAQKPDDPRARLLKIEILVRQDRSVDLFAELEEPVEKLAWPSPEDQFRVASLLGHFGFAERAADLAYRLFLQHRDMSRAWMTLSMLVLDKGKAENASRLWNATEIGPNAAVDLHYNDGMDAFFVVEPNVALRKLDPESWELDHPLVRAVAGLRIGESFVGSDGRKGVVRQIRHKYVARLHYVLEHHEARFPEIMGFRRVTVDFKQPGGLDLLIEQIKARHDWIRQEEAQYLNGPWPIGMLAHRIGMDTIEVGVGLASRGVRLKVAAGNLKERDAADQAVRLNARRGCVLDLLAFWTAWRLKALEAVRATCGPIHLPQGVLDRLRARREQFDDSAHDGLRSAGYDNGKISLQEISAEMIVSFRDDLDRAISWAETNTTISPIVADDNLPAALREHLRSGRSDMFDSLMLARKTGFLLVTDDLPTREFDRVVGGGASAWLNVVFGVALDWKHIDADQYVRWLANLIEAGHNYLGVTGPMLAHAARLDATVDEFPGYLLRTIATVIGGRIADPISHIDAVLGCLRNLWDDIETTRFRQPVTGFLLRQLVRERENDYGVILRTVLAMARDRTGLTNYIHGWLRGHFLVDAVLNPPR